MRSRLLLLLLVVAAALALRPVAAQSPTLSVLANGPYVPGANAVVVDGNGTPLEVAARVEAESDLAVEAIWRLEGGRWVFALPAAPGVAGGLTTFGPAPSAAIVVLVNSAIPTVVLDPGHGGPEVGAAAHGVVEKDSNLDMAFRIERILRARGVRVVLTRTTDARAAAVPAYVDPIGWTAQRLDLQARVDIANAVRADVFVSIHSNGGPDGQRGAEVWYDPDRTFGSENERLARVLQTRVLGALADYGYVAADRGVKSDSCWRRVDDRCFPLFVLGPPRITTREEVVQRGGDPTLVGFGPLDSAITTRATEMPGALVELLFVSDPADASILADDAGRDALAGAVAAGILAFLGRS